MSEDENCLFSFGDYAEELCEEQLDGRKKANRQEREDLLNFLGSFEKWSELDEDCRRHVVGFLDYWTRCKLALCSKSDYELVKNTVLFTSKEKGIRIKPTNINSFDDGVIRVIRLVRNCIEIETSTGIFKSWRLAQTPDGCKILSKVSMKDHFSYSNTFGIPNGNVDEQIVKIAKRVLEKGNEHVESLTVKLTWPTESALPWKFPNLKKLKFISRAGQQSRQWMVNMECRLEEFNYESWFVNPSDPFEQLDCPVVFNAKSLRMFNPLIPNEKLIQMVSSANKIYLSVDKTDPSTLVDLVEKWVNGELSSDFSFLRIRFWEHCRLEVREMLKARLEVTEYNYTNWRHPRRAFFKLFEPNFNGHGDYYEVRSAANRFDILSVLITPECFGMLRTGFHDENFGFPKTEYRYPDFSEYQLPDLS